MNRLDDQEAALTVMEAAFEAIRNVQAGLSHRVAAAEMERDAAQAQTAQSAEDIARYSMIVDRMVELAHKAQAMAQQPG